MFLPKTISYKGYDISKFGPYYIIWYGVEMIESDIESLEKAKGIIDEWTNTK